MPPCSRQRSAMGLSVVALARTAYVPAASAPSPSAWSTTVMSGDYRTVIGGSDAQWSSSTSTPAVPDPRPITGQPQRGLAEGWIPHAKPSLGAAGPQRRYEVGHAGNAAPRQNINQTDERQECDGARPALTPFRLGAALPSPHLPDAP